MSSPTQRSLKHMRSIGYTAAITEHWNNYAHIRQDLFGFVDILAIGPQGTVAVQTTSDGNLSARRKKLLALPAVDVAKSAGWSVVLHGWGKKGGRGKRKLWVLREEAL